VHEKGKHAFISGNVARVLPVPNIFAADEKSPEGAVYVQTG